MLSGLKHSIKRWFFHAGLCLYRCTLPAKVKRLRKKPVIKVLFILSEVNCWKSRLLYERMLEHPRFCPVLGISSLQYNPMEKDALVSYLKSNHYDYVDLGREKKGIDILGPDIIFYYKPYPECYSPGLFYKDNLKYVFCGLDYCFEATTHVEHLEKDYFDYCWQYYAEHPDIVQRREELLGYRACNTVYTGVPEQDLLLRPKECFTDPWKDKTGKKRIIYAPHHSLKGTNGGGIEFATFLEFGELMLELAEKYEDTVTFAFKPHPLLYGKLLVEWGVQKTDRYYKAWAELPNAQVETGEYAGLFKHSDALIHDCASFIVEYMYSDRPALYLMADSNNTNDMFSFVKDAWNCHEHAGIEGDIEPFIKRVIDGTDEKKEKRHDFIARQLVPPGGGNACDNIINAILNWNSTR